MDVPLPYESRSLTSSGVKPSISKTLRRPRAPWSSATLDGAMRSAPASARTHAALAAPSIARSRTRNTMMPFSMAMPGCFDPGLTLTSMRVGLLGS